MAERFTEKDYLELNHVFSGGDITKASKADLERYLVMLSRPNAYAHFGQASFNQICESVRTLIQIRSTENTLPTPREVEQDFKILLSRDQAERDFEEWSKNLSGGVGQIAILFLDIDNFKALNTRYTHTKVDASFLPETMRLLERITRLRGGAYRYGGDEYFVLLPNVDTAEARGFAENIRAAYANHSFGIDGEQIPVTVSIGLAMWPSHGSNYTEVLGRANAAEGQAKLTKNCVIAGGQTASILPNSGLSSSAQKLAAHLCINSQHGLEHDPVIDAESLGELLGMSQETLGAAASELEERGWSCFRKTLGMGKAGFSSLWAVPRLFIEADPVLMGWVPKNDAKAIAKALLQKNDESSNVAELEAELQWGPRRINPALAYLIHEDFVLSSQTMNAYPYTSTWIRAKPKLRRLVE